MTWLTCKACICAMVPSAYCSRSSSMFGGASALKLSSRVLIIRCNRYLVAAPEGITCSYIEVSLVKSRKAWRALLKNSSRIVLHIFQFAIFCVFPSSWSGTHKWIQWLDSAALSVAISCREKETENILASVPVSLDGGQGFLWKDYLWLPATIGILAVLEQLDLLGQEPRQSRHWMHVVQKEGVSKPGSTEKAFLY